MLDRVTLSDPNMIPLPRKRSMRGVGRALLIGATMAATSSAFATPAPTVVPSKPKPLKIVAFGSSSTQGTGATSPSHTYPAQLQQILQLALPSSRRVQVINRGIGGEDADAMMRRLATDVIARQPDVVIWQTGSNDPIHHVPLDRFERETRDGVTAMRAAGIKVILMEPQWCMRLDAIGTSVAYRDIVRKVGRDLDVAVIRRSELMHEWVRKGLLTRSEMLSADGLHMTDGGYAMLARSVAPKVLQIEDIRPVTQTVAGHAPLIRPLSP